MKFPVTKIPPDQDATELALHRVIDAAADFGHAIADAETSARVGQVRRRLSACIELFTQLEDAALRQSERLE
jgi:hypothetical protein